jgi:hypothetical protein
MPQFVSIKEFKELQKIAKEALRLASRHDPDIMKMLERLIKHVNREVGVAQDLPLCHRIDILERQMKRIGAPQYRKVK